MAAVSERPSVMHGAIIRAMNSLPPMPRQSWSSAFVDVAMILAIVILAFRNTHETMPWMVLSQIAFVRFGVGTLKQRQDGGGGGGGGGYSQDRIPRVILPQVTEDRPPGQPGSGPGGASRAVASEVAFVQRGLFSGLERHWMRSPPLMLALLCSLVAVSCAAFQR